MRLTTILFTLCAAHAQDFRATLSGTVSDPTGAAIPKARVRIVQRSTNQSTQVLTNTEGYYSVNFLNPSTYDITVEATGFKLFRQEGIDLMVSQKLEQNFALTVGSVAEQVTVTESSVDIQTADASGGLNFDALQTSEYPLNGRQVYMLMDLAPGVLFTQEQFGSSGFSGTRGWDTNGSYVMNGGVSGSNSFSLNGAPISLTGSWQVAPNVDAIQEFKVMTNTYDAAIGRTGGGSVNTTLKSGTNKWRGSVADFMRNQILDANYWQNNLVGADRGRHVDRDQLDVGDAGKAFRWLHVAPRRQVALGDGEFLEIFIDTPIEICMQRDPKGLYEKARAGKIKNFTGIDSPYEAPERPEIRVDTMSLTAAEAAEQILLHLDATSALGRI
mgnify:CR=1 FL=1